MEPALCDDNKEATDIVDPIDPAEANEPTLARDAKEWELHTESTEFSEQIERMEFCDRIDHTRGSVARAVPNLGTGPARPPERAVA